MLAVVVVLITGALVLGAITGGSGPQAAVTSRSCTTPGVRAQQGCEHHGGTARGSNKPLVATLMQASITVSPPR